MVASSSGNHGTTNFTYAQLIMSLSIDPKNADAYTMRGGAYGMIGEDQKSLTDLKIAARLGNKTAQNYLRSRGIMW